MKQGKRELQKQETRQKILDVAYRKFSEYGIAETKTADIASAANLSHGAIFVHFQTRQDIVNNVIDQFGLELSAQINRGIGNKQSPLSILLYFTEALSKFEDFYTELLFVLPKLPSSIQGSFLMLQNGLAQYLLPALKSKMDTERFKHLGEAGIMNTWFAQLHYYLMNKNWYEPEGSLLKKRGNRIVTEYLELLHLND